MEANDSKPKSKPKRVDGHMTGLAGELFVAAELLKRGLLVSVTFGSAKSIDILAYNEETDRNFNIQAKSLRKKNFFLLGHGKVAPKITYVFVLLNNPTQQVQYFIVPGQTLADEPTRFAKWFLDHKMPGIHPNVLQKEGFENAWQIFHELAP